MHFPKLNLQYIPLLFLIPASISFLLNPLTNDARIYQGVARLTDYFGAFPSNINAAWEIKPIGNRGLNYILYKFSSLFTTFGSWEYEILVKLCALAIVVGICWYFFHKTHHKYAFVIGCLSFIMVLNFIALQAEWWASLFALLAIALFIEDNKWCHYLAGVIITGIFLFKGITIVLVIPIICAAYLFKPELKIWDLIRGSVGSVLSLGAILLCGFFPDVIPDMLMSASIARVGILSATTIVEMLSYNLIPAMTYTPIILPGLIAALCMYMHALQDRDTKRLLVLIAMWISAISIVVVQSEFFAYHYVVLVVPAIVTILVSNENECKIALIATIVIFCIFSSHWSIGMDIEQNFWEGKNIESVNIVNNFTDITEQTSILYLDPGDAPYYFQSNSSCRYISPLVFQRNSEEWNTSGLKQYYDEFSCIMAYQGKYIITDAGVWFEKNTTDNHKVWDMIHSNYTKVWNRSWNIYQKIGSV
ncbi:MAG: hypothetical protein PHT77_11560 [Bacteroidales bacterium]|nr:hypothetical protein [Bacteroidales bacterium]